MTAPLPVREFESVAEMRAHYAAVRARLFRPAAVSRSAPQFPVARSAPVALATPACAADPILPASDPAVRCGHLGAAIDVQAIVCRATGVPLARLRKPHGPPASVKARRIGFWLARTHTSRSWASVGKLFGGRDHSTAFHGHRRVAAVIKTLSIQISDDPAVMASRLWAAEWPSLRSAT